MSTLKNKIVKGSMQIILQLTAAIARRGSLVSLNNFLLRKLAEQRANGVLKNKLVEPPSTVNELGLAWQKAFPSVKQVPLIDITEDTVYAEIRTPCPLKGSGDLTACFRMMEYDRAYLSHFGGNFVVLKSQASSGVNCCKVAMQFSDRKNDTQLKPAHLSVAASDFMNGAEA